MWIAELRCGGDPDYHDASVHAACAPTADPPSDFTAWVDQDRAARERGATDAS